MTCQKGVVCAVAIDLGEALIGLQRRHHIRWQRFHRKATLLVQLIDHISGDLDAPGPWIEIGDRHLVVGVILGGQTNGIRLDAQIGVFGDQHHLGWLAQALRPHLFQRHSQDVVVTPATPQFRWQLGQGFSPAKGHFQGSFTVGR